MDNAYFQNQARNIFENESEERKRRKLPERYFLAVSRLSPEKNYPTLFEAFKLYRHKGWSWDLVIVGAGPLAGHIVDITEINSIPGLHFLDWQSYEVLPLYYALATCFILPGLSETWGLVVNEAMACGLPILMSR
jgi:glycosyltransferase involved in cell wall biosynthesis